MRAAVPPNRGLKNDVELRVQLGEQEGAVAELATEPSVASTPQLEISRERVQQSSLLWRTFIARSPKEKPSTELSVPADGVSPAHLILEESREEQTLRTRCFHQRTVAHDRCVDDKAVEHGRESRWSRPAIVCDSRRLRVVRQHAGVVHELLLIHRLFGHVAQARGEILQHLPMSDREQFLQWRKHALSSLSLSRTSIGIVTDHS